MADSLEQARNLILEYREHVRSKNMDGILKLLCDDVTFQVPGLPNLCGKNEIRLFYETRFLDGEYDFRIDIIDEKYVSDVVFINGRMLRTDSNGGVAHIEFTFILIKDGDGHLKIWQIRTV